MHAPYIFMTAWKVVYPFIDTNTKKKVSSIFSSGHTHLLLFSLCGLFLKLLLFVCWGRLFSWRTRNSRQLCLKTLTKPNFQTSTVARCHLLLSRTPNVGCCYLLQAAATLISKLLPYYSLYFELELKKNLSSICQFYS